MLGSSPGVGSYGESARSLGRRMRSTRKRPAPLLGAVLAWIAAEAGRLPRPEGEVVADWSRIAGALVVATATLGSVASVVLVLSLTA